MVKQGTRYKQIALDLATQIYQGNIIEGSKIKGRSVLSSNYNVSPETIRKAMALLEEVEVVKSMPGSGSIVLSKANAKTFIDKHKTKENAESFKADLNHLLEQKALIDAAIFKKIRVLLDQGLLLNGQEIPFDLIEVPIKESLYVNSSIANSKFWHETGATIIAIKRDGQFIISPSPDEKLKEEDVVVAIKEKL